MYLLLCYNVTVIHKAVMYCMAHDCFYPALGLLLAMTVTYLTLVLLKKKEINKVHFQEKVLNHLLPKKKMIDRML